MKALEKSTPVISTMNVETTGFGIDPDVIPALFDNIYKNKIRTLTQEYMSNARDANREVLQTRRIEVTVPTVFNPNMIIRDFGPGISPDRMYNVFIRIGASTKRDTNTQTGGFGVGCKAYFSYGETFHINTFIDGVKRSYTCYKDGDKKLHLNFHKDSVCETSEPNGTEITLPVQPSDCYYFANAAQRACYFWKESERPHLKGMDELKEILFHKTQIKVGPVEFFNPSDVPDYIKGSVKSTFCVIDGIPYPLNEGIREKVEWIKKVEDLKVDSMSMIIHLNNGAVRVAISREDIDNSNRTIQTLNDVLSLAFPKIEADRNNRLSYKTFEEFITAVNECRKIYDIAPQKFEDFEYSGSTISGPSFKRLEILEKNYGKKKRFQTSEVSHLEDKNFGQGLFFYNDQSTDSQSLTLKKIKEFLSKNRTLILFDAKPGFIDSEGNQITESGKPFLNKLIKLLDIKPLSSLTYTKPVRSPSRYGSSGGTKPTKEEVGLHIIESGRTPTRRLLSDPYLLEKTFVYIDLDSYSSKKSEISALREYFTNSKINKNVVFVAVPKSQIPKIEDHESFMTLEDYKETYEPNNQEVIKYMERNSKNNPTLRSVRNLNITNAAFIGAAELYKDNALFSYSYTGYREYENPPAFIISIIAQNEKVVKFLESDELFCKLVKESYSLVLLQTSNNYLTDAQKKDMENYINNKSQGDK